MSQRALVTGGAGFVGSHLCDRLIDLGLYVTCVDDLSTGREANVAHLLGHERFTLVQHDVIEPIVVKVDQIYNLACPASPVHYQKDPIKTAKTNVLGAINMLELARRADARVLQASTSEVYGDPLEHPQSESYHGNVSCIGPRACYDEGKRVAETLFFDYHRAHGVDIRVARIFNTYGPRMLADDGRVVSNFVVQALRNEPLTVYGDGGQTRSFCFIDDLVAGLVCLMQDGAPEGPVNLGNPNELSVRHLAALVLRLSGSESEISLARLPEDDPARRQPDITLARERLGWEPSVDLEQGLQKTIDYFREVLP